MYLWLPIPFLSEGKKKWDVRMMVAVEAALDLLN